MSDDSDDNDDDDDDDDAALEFFCALSGHLDVKLTEPAKPVAPNLMNLAAPKSAQVATISLRMSVFEDAELRDLTDDEWNRVVFRDVPVLRLRGEGDVVVEHAAPASGVFTVRDLAAAVEATERAGRGSSEWLGGIDVHHIFFEGIERGDDGVWTISWGS